MYNRYAEVAYARPFIHSICLEEHEAWPLTAARGEDGTTVALSTIFCIFFKTVCSFRPLYDTTAQWLILSTGAALHAGDQTVFFPTNWAIIIVRVSSSCGVWASFHLFNELSQSKLQAAGGSPFNTYFMNVLNARVPTHTHATRRVLCVVSAWKLCATSDNSFLK